MDANYIWILFLLALGASFLLSGMEAGVFALNRLRIRRLARSGQKSAKLLNRFLEKPERFLWTILVGNTLANFFIMGWMLVKLYGWFLDYPYHKSLIAGLYILVVFFFYVFFDLLPKMLFMAHPNSLCLSAARVFRPINFLLRPLVVLVDEISQAILRWTGGRAFTGRVFGNREELRAVMQESGGMLTDDEHAMVNRILDLQNYTVGQIARPMAETIGIDADKPVRGAIAVAGEKNLSRLPVWENRNGRRRIAGLLDVGPLLYRESFDAERPASTYMIPALFVDEGLRLEIALRLMQRSGQRMAIVLARDRSEVGIVAVKIF